MENQKKIDIANAKRQKKLKQEQLKRERNMRENEELKLNKD
jgi:hypothetical protein